MDHLFTNFLKITFAVSVLWLIIPVANEGFRSVVGMPIPIDIDSDEADG